MKNFHINPEGYKDPEPVPHFYDIGTRFLFHGDGSFKALIPAIRFA
jgi:hypothetical protein